MEEETMIFLLLFVLGVGSILFGPYLLFTGARALIKIMESKSWKKTIGVIRDARMAYHIHRNDGDEYMSFYLIKEYDYSVLSKEYSSDQRWASDIYFKIKFKPLNEKEKALKKIASVRKLKRAANREKATLIMESMKEDSMEVFYNPDAHSESCLTIKIPFEIYLQIIFSFLVFFAGCFLLYFASTKYTF